MPSRFTKLLTCLVVSVLLAVSAGATPAEAEVWMRPTFTSPASRTTVGPLPKFTGIHLHQFEFHVIADGVALQGAFTEGPPDTREPRPKSTWSFQVTDPMTDGTHSICIYDVDIFEDVPVYTSETSCITVVVGVPKPATLPAPVLLKPRSQSTNDTTPVFSGTGVLGATVTVTLDGVTLGNTLVRDDETWSMSTTKPLEERKYRLDVVQTDRDGNTSDPYFRSTQRIDTQAPAAPWIVGPVKGALAYNPRPPIHGRAPAGSKVKVRIEDENGTVVSAGVAEGPYSPRRRQWAFYPQQNLAKTKHIAYVTETDPAGNSSPESKRTFIVVGFVN